MKFTFESDRPIYIQLVEVFKLSIISNKLKPDEKLPSVREIALNYKVNPNTVMKALIELERLGLIYTERTNGKFVTPNKTLINKYKEVLILEKINSFLTDMNNLGLEKKEILYYLNKTKGEK